MAHQPTPDGSSAESASPGAEFELKLEVPADRHAALAQAMGKPRRKHLQARYFDTAKSELAQAGIVVRVRKEGREWVQTGKAKSHSVLQRLEHNVVLARPTDGSAPEVELARHRDTPLGKKIRKALGLHADAPFPPLVEVFATDVFRQIHMVQEAGSSIEIALDLGHVAAGARREKLCELEFELKSGRPEDAVRVAQAWCTRYGLWLSAISKSAKGRRLAEPAHPVQAPVQAVPFQPPAFARETSSAQLVRAVLHACLAHVLANASEVAAGSTDAEHIHQLRVGIRRLRTALHELKALAPGMAAGWEIPLTQLFRVLGQQRDETLRRLSIQPQLDAAGGPGIDAEEGADEPAAPLHLAVRSAAFQAALLDIFAFAHHAPDTRRKNKWARTLVLSRLSKLHRKITKDGGVFLSLEPAAQHRVRKRLKRLRYLAEFTAPLFPRARVARFLEHMKPAQEALGHYNDELVALQSYRRLCATDPRAWFGVGWLSARQTAHAATCFETLKTFALHRPFWEP